MFGTASTKGPRTMRKPTICKVCGKDKHIKEDKTCWDCAGNPPTQMAKWPILLQ